MDRRESDREDLLVEATAFVRRAELLVEGRNEPVVVGRRRDGSWSVYFGGDPVFHFDAQGRLNRAFRDGRLYRSQGETLAELTRERSTDRTVLCRRDLSPHGCREFLDGVRDRLAELVLAFERGRITVLRSVPEDDSALAGDLVDFVRPILAVGDAHLLAPRLRGKR